MSQKKAKDVFAVKKWTLQSFRLHFYVYVLAIKVNLHKDNTNDLISAVTENPQALAENYKSENEKKEQIGVGLGENHHQKNLQKSKTSKCSLFYFVLPVVTFH